MCNNFCKTLIPMTHAQRAIGIPDVFWESGRTLRIKFMGGTSSQHDEVKAHCVKWLDHADLKFDFVTLGNAEIRINFIAGLGAWSYLGTDALGIPQNQPTMNFGWLDQGVILHEFGHALGLAHEHQNPEGGIVWDEQAVIDDLSGAPNFWDEATIRHNVLDKYDPDDVQTTSLDPMSIMMYPIPQHWTVGDFTTVNNEDLSNVDKEFIGVVYPKVDNPPPPPPPPLPPDDVMALIVAKQVYTDMRDIRRMPKDAILRLGNMLKVSDISQVKSRRWNANKIYSFIQNN